MLIGNPEYSRSKYLPDLRFKKSVVDKRGGILALSLAAMGVVFGDIGTSPLYALKACLNTLNDSSLTLDSVYGVVSIIFWALIFVVSLKYVFFVMRANNHGEGGILALMALAIQGSKGGPKYKMILIFIGIFGSCLFYGDAVITPAISILSALEGLQVISNGLASYVLPLTVATLFVLFSFEKRGTATVGALFGPVMVLWFAVMGLMGIYQIINFPQILQALNPLYAVNFVRSNTAVAFTVTSAIFLVLTGAEALYADMGHFGIDPIRFSWFGWVMPCLLLNYFGQGALLITDPASISNPFFKMVPNYLYPYLVILSTVATVIASQACISGAYSMTSQAIQLGFLPSMKIKFTSDKEIGQIYIPFVNWLLCFLVILVVLVFQKSENLASAYGVAVSTTMLMTTLLMAVVMKVIWRWKIWFVFCVIGTLLTIDLLFFVSNLTKIFQGGWLPLLIGIVIFALMMTWYQGRELLRKKTIEDCIDVTDYMCSLPLIVDSLKRVKGTAIFLSPHIDLVPNSLYENIKHNKVLHERVIFLKINGVDVPHVTDESRINIKNLGNNHFLVRAVYGFKETPVIDHILDILSKHHNIQCNVDDSIFFLSGDVLFGSEIKELSMGRGHLFTFMADVASKTEDVYNFDIKKIIKIGARYDF